MAAISNFEQLTKADRRKQWKLLKDKHSKAISKAKIDFDQKLGPALDKYQSQVEKLTKLAGKGELNTVQVQPVLESTAPLKKIVTTYLTIVKAVEEPAKKELSAVLTAINDDIASWEELAVVTMGTPAKGTTDAQKKAAREVGPILDSVRAMCLTIVTRGPRALAEYKKEGRPEAAALASQMVETARLAGSASHELANAAQQVVAGTNYELFKARAKAAEPLIEKAKEAADAFKAKWVFGAPGMTLSSVTDAMALKGNHEQIVSDFGAAVALLKKLP